MRRVVLPPLPHWPDLFLGDSVPAPLGAHGLVFTSGKGRGTVRIEGWPLPSRPASRLAARPIQHEQDGGGEQRAQRLDGEQQPHLATVPVQQLPADGIALGLVDRRAVRQNPVAVIDGYADDQEPQAGKAEILGQNSQRHRRSERRMAPWR